MTPPKIVLAYSGGLDTSIAIPWLRERHGADVVALALDLGQAVDRHDLQARALAAGAASVRVVDAREEFARDFAAVALRADAFYEDRRPMSRALG
ncbi:MAG: argininosuccinate synthase domain-containing protein, partial [Deltaproteobacteria bacterium]